MFSQYRLPLLLVTLICLPVQADTLELLNGDRVKGEVVGLDIKEIHLKSESFGVIKVPRAKVAVIYLGNRVPSNPRSTNGSYPMTKSSVNTPNRSTPVPFKDPSAVETVNQAIRNAGVNPNSIGNVAGAPNLNKPAQANPNAKAMPAAGNSNTKVNPQRGPTNVVDQLQTQGVDPATLKQLQALFPGLSNPGAKGYFNNTVNGLKSGSTDLLQVRQDAIKARDEFVKMQAQLGPALSGTLSPYLTILNKFIDETTPLVAKQNGATKSPMKNTPAAKQP
ncbi:MAG: hypothetical protein ACKVH8_02985 [Pirellulales bacterium]